MMNGLTNKLRISGLNSQMDTEGIVKAMSAATQMQINTKKRRVLLLQAQQNAYRDVIAKLQNFQNSYFNAANPNSNLRRSTLFTRTTSTVFTKVNGVETAGKPVGVSIETASNAKQTSYSVILKNNATQANIKGDNFATSKGIDVGTEFSDPSGSYAFSMTVGNVTKNLVVKQEAGDADMRAAINRVLADAFGKKNDGTGIVSMDVNGVVSSSDKKSITYSNVVKMSNQQILDYLTSDLKTGMNYGYMQVGDKMGMLTFQTVADDYFDMLFDSSGNLVLRTDEEAHIKQLAETRFSTTTPTQAQIDTVKNEYNRKLYELWDTTATDAQKDALFNDYFQYRLEDQQRDRFEQFKKDNPTTTFTNWQDWRDDKITKAEANTANWDKFYAEERQAAYDEYKAALPTGTTAVDISDEAGWGWTDTKATIQAAALAGKGTGLGTESAQYIRFLESSGVEPWRLDADMFKAASYDARVAFEHSSTNVLTDGFRSGFGDTSAVVSEKFNEKSLTKAVEGLKMDGVEKFVVNFVGGKAIIMAEDASGAPVATGFTIDPNSANADVFNAAVYKPSTATVNVGSTLEVLGLDFSGASSKNIVINGVSINLTKTMTVSQMMERINSSRAGVKMTFSELSNSFTLTAEQYGTAGKIDFGTDADTLDFVSTLCVGNPMETGQNLILNINGNDVEATSNSYTIDGTTFKFDPFAVGGQDAAGNWNTEFRVDTKADKTTVADTIKNFVSDYNKLIEEVFALLDDKPDKDYYFLTDDDIADSGFSDREVEKWESMSKKGLLYQNSTVGAVMGELRNALMKSVTGKDGKQFSIYNIRGNAVGGMLGEVAIKPVNNYKKHGILEFDEQALLEALDNNPEDIMKLFTDDGGIMAGLQEALDRAISTEIIETKYGTRKGSLIRLAGTASAAQEHNSIYGKIKDLNDSISRLQRRYDAQQDRYWKMFTAMEKQLSVLYGQSGAMANMFGGGQQQQQQ